MAKQTEVIVVCGPVGSGKSRYVAEHAEAGDLIIDVDCIWSAVSGRTLYDKSEELLPFVLAARKAMIRRLLHPSDLKRAWLITTKPDRAKREEYALFLKAKIVVLEVPVDECMRRIENDERRVVSKTPWRALADDWWRLYTRRPGDVIVD